MTTSEALPTGPFDRDESTGGGGGHIVLALDKFKGTMSSLVAAEALSAGIRASAPDLEIAVLPMADGGEGTLELLLARGFTEQRVEVAGADGRPLTARFAFDGATAVIESAAICGPVPGRPTDPVQATSVGVAQAILAALHLAPRDIVLTLGGSTTTDGGAGFLAALGVRFLDRAGARVAPVAARLHEIARVDWSGLHPQLARVGLRVACDVENPLTGPDGTAAVFAPQKGAGPEQVRLLESGLRQLANAVEAGLEPPAGAEATAGAASAVGAGAAGGLGYAARLLGAQYVSGAEFALAMNHGARHLAGAVLAVTGEGTLDAQSLRGKAAHVVARAAQTAGVPAIAVVGRNLLEPDQLHATCLATCFALLDRDPTCADSPSRSMEVLTAIGAEIGAVVSGSSPRAEWNQSQRDLAAQLAARPAHASRAERPAHV